jgi:indole-3-glycerol phosphate synthase
MNVLDKIIAYKKKEIAQLKREVLVEKLVKSPGFKRKPLSLK